MIIIATAQALCFLCAVVVRFVLGGCVVTGFKFHTLSLCLALCSLVEISLQTVIL